MCGVTCKGLTYILFLILFYSFLRVRRDKYSLVLSRLCTAQFIQKITIMRVIRGYISQKKSHIPISQVVARSVLIFIQEP